MRSTKANYPLALFLAVCIIENMSEHADIDQISPGSHLDDNGNESIPLREYEVIDLDAEESHGKNPAKSSAQVKVLEQRMERVLEAYQKAMDQQGAGRNMSRINKLKHEYTRAMKAFLAAEGNPARSNPSRNPRTVSGSVAP